MLLGIVGVALALLVVFAVTVGLLIYAGSRSRDREDARTAVETRSERQEDVSQARRTQPNLLPAASRAPLPATGQVNVPQRTEAPSAGPPETLPKSLATMDRLTLAAAPAPVVEAPTPEVWAGHTASIRGVAFTDDGRFVVSVSGAIQKEGKKEDNSIRVWDARRGKQIHKLDGFREALDAVSVSPGGRFAVFGHGGHYEEDRWVNSIDHRVHLWDIQENQELYFRKDRGGAAASEGRFVGLDSSVDSTAFSPDRKRVAGTDNSGRLVLWEADTGTIRFRGKVEAVARPRTDEVTGAQVRLTLRGANCVFTPDGRYLLAGGADYTVRLFDAASGVQLQSFESHEDIVWAVAATRTKDGRLLGLSGGGDQQALRQSGFIPGARDYAIRLWDLNSRKEIRRFVGHEGSVQTLAFCPNGRHFLSAGTDQTVRLWDVDSGKLLRSYRGHTNLVRSVAVSPDGRAAVSGGDDCTLRYWRLPAQAQDVILALDTQDRQKLAEAIGDMDAMDDSEVRTIVPQLLKPLRQKDEAIGSMALGVLRRLDEAGKEGIKDADLPELLNSPQPDVRRFAADALARLERAEQERRQQAKAEAEAKQKEEEARKLRKKAEAEAAARAVEEVAATKLKLAKQLRSASLDSEAEGNLREGTRLEREYRNTLHEIMANYPTSKAAAEAKKLLED